MTTLPEAPPPYPNFPVPYDSTTTGNNQADPFAAPFPVRNSPYQPEVRSKSWSQSVNAFSPTPNYSRFTVHAKANLWLLVQDPKGNELDWLKMQGGEKIPLSHAGPLTLTCSSGRDVEIFDRGGKKIDVPDSGNAGITIIRLN